MSLTVTNVVPRSEPRVSALPKLVDGADLGAVQRLLARIDRKHLGNGLYLGYCPDHRAYYLDREHTDGSIRCPVCDEEWLFEHGF